MNTPDEVLDKIPPMREFLLACHMTGYLEGEQIALLHLSLDSLENEIKRKQAHTNADKIRAMTDKKLAEWISDEKITGCPEGLFYSEIACEGMACFDCWLDWLKMEAE